MADDIDWNEEIAEFDTNSANEQSRIMWLKIAYACRECAEGGLEYLEEPEYADRAIAYANRAEACMWRATGDRDSIDLPPAFPPTQERLHP